jgi:aryl-alcohol dehydrogenase-like predicted oxidoreductase
METRPLGSSGLRVSLVGLGCNQFGGKLDQAGTTAVVNRALELGIDHFDTADIYGNRGRSEELLGVALGARRKDIVLVTKFAKPMSDAPPPNRGSRAYVASAVEASLRRLKTDWIDLLFMHEPDPSTPIEETFRALRICGRPARFATSPRQTSPPRRSRKPPPSRRRSASKASSPARTS